LANTTVEEDKMGNLAGQLEKIISVSMTVNEGEEVLKS
jgi:hypothetical protein